MPTYSCHGMRFTSELKVHTILDSQRKETSLLVIQSYIGERYKDLLHFKQIYLLTKFQGFYCTLNSASVHTNGEKIAEILKKKHCHTFVGKQSVHWVCGSRWEICFQICPSVCLNLLLILQDAHLGTVRWLLRANVTAGAEADCLMMAVDHCTLGKGLMGSIGCDGIA